VGSGRGIVEKGELKLARKIEDSSERRGDVEMCCL
jgi:hypothetical protein